MDEYKTYSVALTYLKPNTKPTILKKYIGTFVVGTEATPKIVTDEYFDDIEYPDNLAVHCET